MYSVLTLVEALNSTNDHVFVYLPSRIYQGDAFIVSSCIIIFYSCYMCVYHFLSCCKVHVICHSLCEHLFSNIIVVMLLRDKSVDRFM